MLYRYMLFTISRILKKMTSTVSRIIYICMFQNDEINSDLSVKLLKWRGLLEYMSHSRSRDEFESGMHLISAETTLS